MKNKIVKFLKKYWFIIAILIISLARFLFTYNSTAFVDTPAEVSSTENLFLWHLCL